MGDYFEFGIYVSYALSLVQDLDLNIINNLLYTNYDWLVSTTYNFPDIHEYGTAFLWLPFYMYIHLLKLFGVSSNIVLFDSTVIDGYIGITALVSIVFSLGGVCLIYKGLRSVIPKWQDKFILFLALFCTPLFFYTFGTYTGSETTLFLVSNFAIYLAVNKKLTTLKQVLLLGVLVGIARTIKVSVVFLLPFFLYYLVTISNSKKEFLKKAFLFGLGFGVVEVFRHATNYFRYGFSSLFTVVDSYLSWDSFLNSSIPSKIVFGPNSIFINNPLYLIGIILFAIYLVKLLKKQRLPLEMMEKYGLVLLACMLFKFSMGFFIIFEQSTEFGGRHFINDIFGICIVLFYFLKNNRYRKTVMLFFLLCSMYQLIILLTYIEVPGFKQCFLNWKTCWISEPHVLIERFVNLLRILFNSFSPSLNNILFLLKISPVVILVSVFILFKMFPLGNTRVSIRSETIIIVLLLVLLSSSILNFYFNFKNVEVMKRTGRFDNVIIGTGPNLFVYDDYTDEMFKLMEQMKRTRKREQFEYSKGIFKSFLKSIPSEVKHNGAKFLKEIEEGVIYNRFEKHYYFLDNLFDFDNHTKFYSQKPVFKHKSNL